MLEDITNIGRVHFTPSNSHGLHGPLDDHTGSASTSIYDYCRECTCNSQQWITTMFEKGLY